MRRTIAILAALGATLLSVATIASLWCSYSREGHGAFVRISEGRFEYDTLVPAANADRYYQRWGSVGTHPFAVRLLSAYSTPAGFHVAAIPLWPLALGFAAIAFIAHRRARKPGCKKCEYSLLGLPSSSPCPECGSPRPS